MKTLIIGATIIDIIMEIPTLPKTGDDILCESNMSTIGGCAYNVASIFRNLDLEHELFVPVGSGNYGEIIKNDLNKYGYKILAKSDIDNGFCICFVENDGERSFVTVKGAEGHFKKEWFQKLNMNEYEYIYICGYQTVGHSGKIIAEWLCKISNKKIFFAPGPMFKYIDKTTLENIFSTKPIIHLSEKEIMEFFENNSEYFSNNTDADAYLNTYIKKLYELSKNTVIVTLGNKGAIYFNGNILKLIKPYQTNVVDTIGAGDSHIATIMASLILGYDIENAINLGNKVASKVVSTKGAIIEKSDLEKCLG